MDFSLKTPFTKSRDAYQHIPKVSVNDQGTSDTDSGTPQVTIKMNGIDQYSHPSATSSCKGDTIAKNSGNRESFEFMQRGDDPSSVLNKQNSPGGGEIAVDVDMEISSRQHSTDRSRETRVSFDPNPIQNAAKEYSLRRRYKDSPEEGDQITHGNSQQQKGHGDEVLKCTSNVLLRKATLTKTKTNAKSRLLDPEPEETIEFEFRSGGMTKSGQILRSGLLMSKNMGGGGVGGDEDDDPFLTEDFPEEYRRVNLNALTLIQWVSLVLIVAALICSLSIPELKRVTLWDLKLWKWEAMVLVLICGRLVSGWGIRLIVFFIERNFVLRKRILYFVYGVRKPVQNCWWLGLVLIAWEKLFDSKVRRHAANIIILDYITKILICLLIGTLLWLLKTLMIKVLASSFHVSTYFDRIQESLFNQYVIETLSGPPLIEIQMNDEDERRMEAEIQKLQNAGAVLPPDLRDAAFPRSKSGRGVMGKSSRHKSIKKLNGTLSTKGDGDSITIDHLHKLNPKNVSAWNMKRLIKMVRYGSLSTLDEQIQGHEDESVNQIRSEYEAKAAARKIFLNVARQRSKRVLKALKLRTEVMLKFIYLEDLLRFMKEEEALKTLSLFEGAYQHGRISKSSLKNWVVNSFRERRALALTLNDTTTVVNQLNKIVNIIVGIIILIISFIILNIATSQFFLLLTSQLVLAAFVFGNTCKSIFEALIFLFVVHPFDVGDRCEIDGVQMIVEEMNVLTTVFLRYDNLKVIYPNSSLVVKPIFNYYRSPDMVDTIEFSIHVSTPTEKIALMRQRIVGYIEGKKEHWCASPLLVLKDVPNLTSIKMVMWPIHKMNFQDIDERFKRRSLLIEEMGKIFRDLDIQYRLFPLDINVRSISQLPHSPPLVFDRMPSTWPTSSSTTITTTMTN